jgi:hypothetical protein
MTPFTIVNVLSLLGILLTPTASASYFQGTDNMQQLVIAEAKRQNMDPSLALAIAKVESNFNPQALSQAGAKGVMQIMPHTAEQVFGVSRARLFDPDINIELGVKFIKKLLERYDGRLDIALSHYNGGSGVKNRRGELDVMPATRDYVDKVLATQQDFLKHNTRPLFAAHTNNTGIKDLHADTAGVQLDTLEMDSNYQDPQIETLRALRLHNITRNYKGKITTPVGIQASSLKKSPSVQASLSAKMAKVKQWESIYPD